MKYDEDDSQVDENTSFIHFPPGSGGNFLCHILMKAQGHKSPFVQTNHRYNEWVVDGSEPLGKWWYNNGWKRSNRTKRDPRIPLKAHYFANYHELKGLKELWFVDIEKGDDVFGLLAFIKQRLADTIVDDDENVPPLYASNAVVTDPFDISFEEAIQKYPLNWGDKQTVIKELYPFAIRKQLPTDLKRYADYVRFIYDEVGFISPISTLARSYFIQGLEWCPSKIKQYAKDTERNWLTEWIAFDKESVWDTYLSEREQAERWSRHRGCEFISVNFTDFMCDGNASGTILDKYLKDVKEYGKRNKEIISEYRDWISDK